MSYWGIYRRIIRGPLRTLLLLLLLLLFLYASLFVLFCLFFLSSLLSFSFLFMYVIIYLDRGHVLLVDMYDEPQLAAAVMIVMCQYVVMRCTLYVL